MSKRSRMKKKKLGVLEMMKGMYYDIDKSKYKTLKGLVHHNRPDEALRLIEKWL